MTPSHFRAIRLELGLKQEEMAEILCVSHSMVIGHYESGFRKPSKLIQVIMSILESLPKKRRMEFLNLVRRHIKSLDSPGRKASHGKS